MRVRDGWPLVWSLALAQLVSWGSIYYSFSLFVGDMEAELGWGRPALNGALSLGLMASGLAAYPVGAWIDRHGGRAVMTAGSLLGAALLLAWSQIHSLVGFYLLWLGLGLALSATLYDPVFAVVTRRFPHSYRTRITALTLIGGFASTVFIPLTKLFIDTLGWRHALVALALCNILICLPIHFWLLDDRGPGAEAPSEPGPSVVELKRIGEEAMRRALRHRVFWSLAICFTAYYATFSAMTFHLIPLLGERGVAGDIIVATYATIGPAQVAGRIIVFSLRRVLSSANAGRLAFAALPVSVLILLAFPGETPALFAFAILYGLGNGVVTVVRGTAVPDLMWREGYGAINGALALPSNVARAVAPFGAAWIWSISNAYPPVLWMIFFGAIAAAAGFWLAASWGRVAVPPRGE